MSDIQVEHFREQLSQQTSLTGAALLLAESASALGWDLAAFHFDIEQLIPPRGNGEFIGVTMGWPAECINGWVNLGMGRYCPVSQQCGRASDSFVWGCDPASAEWGGHNLLPEQRRVLDHYGKYFAGGVTVPVHRPGGKTGFVSWCMRDRDAIQRTYSETYSATYLISLAFILHADFLAISRKSAITGMNVNALSPREIECLSWAARGKTEEEVGTIIRRSHETARFHLRNAALKLNASNRTHAVAIACSRGLITVC